MDGELLFTVQQAGLRLFDPRLVCHTPHAYFLACRHNQHDVLQCGADLRELWLEPPKGSLYRSDTNLSATKPKGSSTETFARCNDSQLLRVVDAILPTSVAPTPPVLCAAQRVLRIRLLA